MNSASDRPVDGSTFTVEPHVGEPTRCQTLFTDSVYCGQNATIDVINALGEVFSFCEHCARAYRQARSEPAMPPDLSDEVYAGGEP